MGIWATIVPISALARVSACKRPICVLLAANGEGNSDSTLNTNNDGTMAFGSIV